MRKKSSPVLHVSGESAGKTLAAALRGWPTAQSARAVERLVRSRRVMVSGNLCVAGSRRLRPGDVVKILPHAVSGDASAADIQVRYEDLDIVVVEKPAGMTSVPHPDDPRTGRARGRFQPTLYEHLRRILAKRGAQRGGSRLPQLRAVHRLDRDTSGLMLFARTHAAQQILGQQFRLHAVERVYWAVVEGKIGRTTLESLLGRDRGDGRRGSVREGVKSKLAVTHVRPLESMGPYTLVECRLETGRTHQIRIHLAEAGHPVCGERIYRRTARGRHVPDHSRAPRLALHAGRLGFTHPRSGDWMEFEMAWPEDLNRWLKGLRSLTRRGPPAT